MRLATITKMKEDNEKRKQTFMQQCNFLMNLDTIMEKATEIIEEEDNEIDE